MSRWSVAAEASRARDSVRMLAEPDAALSKASFEGVDVGEGLVSGDFTQQRPKVLSGVQLGCVGWQENEPEIVRHGELRRAVPGSAVKHKQSDDVYRQ